MSVVTLFNYFKRPKSCLPLINVLHQIKTGKYRRKIEQLRKYYDEDLGSEYDAQKRVIPRFSVSANFRLVDEQLKVVSYSGNLLLEIPYLNERDMKAVKMLLANDPYVMAFFENALGNGLVFIVRSDGKIAEHQQLFTKALKYYQFLTGINRISTLGQRIEHTCMVSLDEHVYLRLDAAPFSSRSKFIEG